MKNIRIIALLSLVLCFMFCLIACRKKEEPVEQPDKEEEIEIKKTDEDTHYLKFMENNAEVLRIVVLENETYEDLLPYFPTLTEVEGFIKYWDGDYAYTNYTEENQFQIYDEDDAIIEVYAYEKRAN